MKRFMKAKVVVAILGAMVINVGLVACGSGDDASREDAHDVRGNLVDKTQPHIVTFNNKYPNVATKCIGEPPKGVDGAPQGDRDPSDTAASGGGWRVVVTTSKSIALVQDPKCPGYVKDANLDSVTIPSP